MTTKNARSEHSTHGIYVHSGEEYNRDTNYIEDRVLASTGIPAEQDRRKDGIWPVEPGRYRLVAARACSWANRTLIVRRLLGLEETISVGMPGPTHDARSWTFDLDEGKIRYSASNAYRKPTLTASPTTRAVSPYPPSSILPQKPW